MEALFTRDDYHRLPEGYPAQLIRGCLVKEAAPTYGHQRALSRLHARLERLVGPDLVLQAPADVGLGEHDVYQPDLVVLREAPRLTERDVGIPVLAIEVLSPTSRQRDRKVKTRALLAAGVAEVWLADPDEHLLERHTRTGVRVSRGAEAVASDAVPGFTTSADDLFA